jgi:thiol:disulfide interchange protein/DsbC/DsbD-like thiol-disulfide interchange protein
MIISRFLALVFVGLFLIAGGPAFAQDQDAMRHVDFRLVTESKTIEPGQTFYIAIEQTIEPGWHTYWKNAGDSGMGMQVSWILPEGFTAGELQWPVPHRIPTEPLMNFGYEHRAVMLAPITAGENLPENDVFEISADIEVLVCEEICIPEFGTYSVELQSSAVDVEAVNSQMFFDEARENLPRAVSWDGELRVEDHMLKARFTPDEVDFVYFAGAEDAFLFPEEWGLIENAAPQTMGMLDSGDIEIAAPYGGRDYAEIPQNSRFVLSFVDADGTHQGFLLDLAKSEIAPVLAAPMDGMVEDVAVATEASLPAEAGSYGGTSVTLLTAIAFALLGGMILNLMPCVFPILSMKAVSLCELAHKDKALARRYGLSYTAGVLFSFGVIAGALLVLKSAGAQIGWGFQLQNPVIVLSLAFLMFVIGLNFSGVFNVGGSLGNVGSKLAGQGGLRGSFFTGMLATIVATPCTAPFMGVAMGFALTQPAYVAMFVFLCLGLGLALPYLALAFVPALQSRLPKPGLWMETFKEFLAFPMYATAAWLLWIYGQQVGDIMMLYALFSLIGIALSIWMFRHNPVSKMRRRMTQISAAVILLLSLLAPVLTCSECGTKTSDAQIETSTALARTSETMAFSAASLETALQSDQPVFVNMTAAWCITCKANERIALNRDVTKALFATNNVLYLKGDWTNYDGEITSFLNEFGRQGVPLYVFYGAPDAETGLRPDPVVLPQILTTGILEETIKGDTK